MLRELKGHYLGKELLSRLIVLFLFVMFAFEGRILLLIVPVSGHCLLFYFSLKMVAYTVMNQMLTTFCFIDTTGLRENN